MNTSAPQLGEKVVMYLLRRAHRKIHPDWATPLPSKKPKKGKDTKKKNTSEQTYEALTQETLAAEKDAGEVEVVSAEVRESLNIFSGV